ncbi:MAG: DNA polymerase IV [Clostridia bacterium]|nr:DNA polymerase IV [Clostridia bacterium]
MERVILHSDLNNFFASVEATINPEYAGEDKFIAVCGLEEDRHGIVLAKNENAKRMGVKTGDTIRTARLKCPQIIIVPPHFESYLHYSRLVREIYLEYTDEVEPFGMDECWLDVTHSTTLFGSGEVIAEKIRRRVKKELGLTVSIGVSFNKIFAKLGSDMKKPDAITVISRQNFREKLWDQPAGNMLGVGRSTLRVLEKHGIFTIGDIARTPIEYMKGWLGKCGALLHVYANGLDDSRVSRSDFSPKPKSISHGVTCREDLTSQSDVSKVLLYLSGDISTKLRREELLSSHVSVCVRDTSLETREYSTHISSPTRSREIIARTAFDLFCRNYHSDTPVRALTVRTSELSADSEPVAFDFFTDVLHEKKLESKGRVSDELCTRYGKNAILPASLLCDFKLPSIINKSLLPPGFRT